jgi:hypothetical protein
MYNLELSIKRSSIRKMRKPSQSTRANLREFQRLQHRVRGVIGASRAKRYERVPRERILAARIKLNAILSEARKHLDGLEYEAFLDWSDRYTKSQARTIESAKYRYDELGSFSKDAPLSLPDEIDSVSSRLALASDAISGFRQLAELVEFGFWHDHRKSVQETLLQMESTFGHTLWLIEGCACQMNSYGVATIWARTAVRSFGSLMIG